MCFSRQSPSSHPIWLILLLDIHIVSQFELPENVRKKLSMKLKEHLKEHPDPNPNPDPNPDPNPNPERG